MGDASEAERGIDPYREVFERSADAILIIEGDTFVDCNEAAVRMLRFGSREAMLSTHPSDLSPPTQPDGRSSYEKANEMIATAFAQGSHRFEWDHRRADGEVFPVEVLLTAFHNRGRRVLHVVWRDITERRLLENQLRHALKLEAVGKLAGGIAHDFNNLLVVILGNANLLEYSLRDQPAELELVHQVLNAGEQAAELVKRLLAFGRKQAMEPEAIDLNRLVNDLSRLILRMIGEDVRLETRLAAEPVCVKADRGQLSQVLLNLASNARDAMAHGGTMRISTATTRDEDDGGACWAELVIADTGDGMDASTAARAFDPFFTTKPMGQGSGLGLSTVYGIVTQSRGTIQLDSTPGIGTRVVIRLPLCMEVPLAGSGPATDDGPGGTERVLVVEDEPDVRALLVRVLSAAGYLIELAHDGGEAMVRLQMAPTAFDLILSDVIMPNMDGPRLLEELHERGLRPRVLFMSGHTDDKLARARGHGTAHELIHKPFTPRELLVAVRRALDKPSTGSG